MIYLCPNCGHSLPSGLVDGIAYCSNCGQSLDSSLVNKMMCAAWMCLRQNPDAIDKIQKAIGLPESAAIVVESLILHSCYSIDEFKAAMKELGIRG